MAITDPVAHSIRANPPDSGIRPPSSAEFRLQRREGANMIARSIGKKWSLEVVVSRAGPYGLAVAAHLKSRGVATHTFGEPMSFWRRHMPKGPGGALSADRDRYLPTLRGRSRSKPIARGQRAPLSPNRCRSKLSSIMANGFKLARFPTSTAVSSSASRRPAMDISWRRPAASPSSPDGS